MTEYYERLAVAQNHFDWAITPEEIDSAIDEMAAAESALLHHLQEKKEVEN